MLLFCHVSSHDQQIVSGTALFFLPGRPSSHNQQGVSDLPFFLFARQAYHVSSNNPTGGEWHSHFLPGSLIMPPPMINRWWVTTFSLLHFHNAIPWTNRGWVTLHFSFARQSHCVSSHDQQGVSNTVFYYFFTKQPHCIQSSHDQQAVSGTAFLVWQTWCLILWPLGCEYCIFYFLGY